MLTIIFLQHSNSRSSRAAFKDKYDEDDPGGNDFFFKAKDLYITRAETVS